MALPSPYSRRFGTKRRDEYGNQIEGEYNEKGLPIGTPVIRATGSAMAPSLPRPNGVGRAPGGYAPKGSVFDEAFLNRPAIQSTGLPVADARNAVEAGRLRMGLPTIEQAQASQGVGSRIASAAGTGNTVQTPYGTVSSSPAPRLRSFVGTSGEAQNMPLNPKGVSGVAQNMPARPSIPTPSATQPVNRTPAATFSNPVQAPSNPLASTPPKTLTREGRTVINPMAGTYNAGTNALPRSGTVPDLAGANRTMERTTPRLPMPAADMATLPTARESITSSDPQVRAGAPGLTAWESNMEGDPLSPRNILRMLRKPRQASTPLKDRIVGSY